MVNSKTLRKLRGKILDTVSSEGVEAAVNSQIGPFREFDAYSVAFYVHGVGREE